MYRKQFKLDGIRKDSMKDFNESYVVLECIVRNYEEPHLCVLNGITGRESIAISQLQKRGFTVNKNWKACYGSRYKWDELEVLGESLEFFLEDWNKYLAECEERRIRKEQENDQTNNEQDCN